MRLNVIAAGTAALLLSALPVFADNATSAATPAAAPSAAAVATPAAAPAAAAQVPDAAKAWVKFCDPDPKDGHQICIVRKFAFNGTSIVGSLTLRVDSKKGVPTLAVAAVPVGVVLKPGLRWQIDGAKAQGLPFWRCTQQTCESEQLINGAFVGKLRNGTTLTLTAKDVANKDFAVTIPLAGFSAAYDNKNAPTFEQYSKGIAQ